MELILAFYQNMVLLSQYTFVYQHEILYTVIGIIWAFCRICVLIITSAQLIKSLGSTAAEAWYASDLYYATNKPKPDFPLITINEFFISLLYDTYILYNYIPIHDIGHECTCT